MEILNKEISKEADVIVKYEDGKLILGGEYEGAGGGVSLEMYAKPEYLLREIARVIPGKVDDLIVEGFIAALK